MKWPAYGVFVLVVLGALATARAVAQLWPPAPPAAGRPITIMPLGDSITVGWPDTGYGGYRRRLAALLTRDGYAVRFVGSQRSGIDLASGPANEGHLGWTIPQITAGIDSHRWLETYRPDIILLYIGTNDLNGSGAASAPANLSALLGDIHARMPDARVIVARIIPFRSGADKDYAGYVSAIPAIVARYGPHFSVVDMRAILTSADYADRLHPNNGGYDKIAPAWDTAIRAAVPLPGH
ncbi:MAG TPA: SGNH/GDSL hydrolase family protein [bacterium]|nr:SGNH/GDSL hydrolase family protein [bacterium]